MSFTPTSAYLKELLKITPKDVKHVWDDVVSNYESVSDDVKQKAKKSWDEWVLTSTSQDFELESPAYKAHDFIMRQIVLEALYLLFEP